ncbi:type II toxin-antitoxin system HicB family antitoxin [Methyloceanibacter sp.]|uniref:type II toxin-antitoxin system HicB family antitoxin n=1 Tax=Methyloceanibacter sp. TaxID=1965321 RepID=UPI003D6C7A99
MTLRYRIKLEPDDNGTLLVTSPDFPEVTTFGESKDDALRHARNAIEEAIAARIAAKQQIPKSPDTIPARHYKVQLPWQTELKVLLYHSLRKANLTRADLARRLRWPREQVDRLFRLDHASRLDQLEAAFNALGIKIDELTARLWADQAEEVSLESLTADELAAAYIDVQVQNIKTQGNDVVFTIGDQARLVVRHDDRGNLVETKPEGLRVFRYRDEIYFAP